MPKVSVLFSVYNGERFVREAIQSILSQSFTDFEFILVDDGSTDGTKKIIKEFSDPRIIVLENKKNMGLIFSLNAAMEKSRGEFIARMDADDVSRPERFAKQLAYLEQNPEIGVLGTAMEQVDADGNHLSVLRPPLQHELILWKMFFGCPIFHATVMARSALFKDAGGYNPEFIHAEDTDLWSRLFGKTKFANLGEDLYVRCLHGKSVISRYSDTQSRLEIKIKKKMIEQLIKGPASDNIVEWFLQPDRTLDIAQKREARSLLMKMRDLFIGGISEPRILAEIDQDVSKRIEAIERSDKNIMLKKIFSVMKGKLPSPLRHKLKSYFRRIFK